MASPWAELAAWLLLPAVMLVTAAGVGLLVERALRVRLPGELVVPLGLCACFAGLYPLYRAGLNAAIGVPVLVLAAVAGLVVHRRSLRREVARVAGGWVGLTALGAFLLFLAPAALTGGWTWTGYNFVNDTAFQLVLIDWIGGHGIPYDPQPRSTYSEAVRAYLLTAYPVGSHAHLATLSAIVRAPGEVVYQSYLSGLAACTALALHALARRAGLRPPLAAAAAVVAAAAGLTYHYALQGNIKEMAMLATLVAAVALGANGLGQERPLGHALCLAVAFAASICVYYAAALPYVAVVAALLAVAALVLAPGWAARRRLAVAAVVAGVACAVVAAPALAKVAISRENLEATFSAANLGELGQLGRPLPVTQAAGIWLAEDYRFPVGDPAARIATGAGIVLVGLLAVVGTALLIRRRELGTALLLGTGVLVYLLVSPRSSPYGDGKMLALLSPAVVLAALVGAFAVRGRLRVPALAAAAVVALLVGASAAIAYHGVRLAPTERMASLADVADRYAGSRQLMLLNEFEEFGKVFMRDARVNTPTEALTEAHIELREGGDFPARSFDTDQMIPAWLQRYPFIVLRRKPTASRPPANYALDYRNADYEVWRRTGPAQLVDSFPLNDANDADAAPPCDLLLDWAGAADSDLVAARRPETVTFDFPDARDRPVGWPPDPERPGQVVLSTPGIASGSVTVRGGRYQAWLEGAFGRPMTLRIDGREVGAAAGINTPGGWLRAGAELELAPGRHTVQVERPGGGFAPGDGARSTLGAVALVAPGEAELVPVARSDARSLCGEQWDWVQRAPAPEGT